MLFPGFLLSGTLRALGLLRWRLEQLEATTPSRLGRGGIKAGEKAPDFTLASAAGGQVSLYEHAGHKVLLVFTQAGCGPCRQIMPELGRLNQRDLQVLVVNRGDGATTRQWAADLGARFPVLIQDGVDLSRKYEAFATPFAFLIDEKGLVVSKGILTHKEHLGYVLSGSRTAAKGGRGDHEPAGTESVAWELSHSHSVPVKEVDHV